MNRASSIEHRILKKVYEMKVISKMVFLLLISGAGILASDAPPAFLLASASLDASRGGRQKQEEGPKETLVYRGMSDASAAVAIGVDSFIVADDENNILRVYKNSTGGLPESSYDMTDFLDIEPEYPEADIEGATTVGDRIWLITSHGRNKDGKLRPNRYRFFATAIKIEGSKVHIVPFGKPCKTLIHSLVETPTGRRLGLDKATRFDKLNLTKKERENLAPKEQGLNIEGLCASADGKIIYIGFRNPLISDKRTGRRSAIVIPLNNPQAVIEKGQTPIFGEPLLWELDGLGIRSMEYSPFHKTYFIVAGLSDERPGFALYSWSGEKNVQPTFVQQLSSKQSDFSPEALVVFKNSNKILLLSDDGTLPVKVSGASDCLQGELLPDGTCPNKSLTDPNKRTFRGMWLEF